MFLNIVLILVSKYKSVGRDRFMYLEKFWKKLKMKNWFMFY